MLTAFEHRLVFTCSCIVGNGVVGASTFVIVLTYSTSTAAEYN